MGEGILLGMCIVAIAAAITAVAVLVDRTGARKADARERELKHETEVQQLRMREAAEKEARAANFYTLQSTLQTIQRQAEIQGRSTAAATAALGTLANIMGENDRAALEALRSRAIVDEYTRMLLAKQKEPEKLPRWF